MNHIRLFEDFLDKAYEYIGCISYTILPSGDKDLELFDNYIKSQKNPFHFQQIDKVFSSNLSDKSKEIFNISDKKNFHQSILEVKLDYAIRKHYQFDFTEFDQLEISLFNLIDSKGLKKGLTIYVSKGSDDFLFVTFNFVYWGSSYNYSSGWAKKESECWQTDMSKENVNQWEAYICDIAYEDGFTQLLLEIKSRFLG